MKNRKAKIKDIKKGEFFRLKDSDAAPVWARGEYVRESKKYSTTKFDDVNHERLMNGNTEVYIGFEF